MNFLFGECALQNVGLVGGRGRLASRGVSLAPPKPFMETWLLQVSDVLRLQAPGLPVQDCHQQSPQRRTKRKRLDGQSILCCRDVWNRLPHGPMPLCNLGFSDLTCLYSSCSPCAMRACWLPWRVPALGWPVEEKTEFCSPFAGYGLLLRGMGRDGIPNIVMAVAFSL